MTPTEALRALLEALAKELTDNGCEGCDDDGNDYDGGCTAAHPGAPVFWCWACRLDAAHAAARAALAAQTERVVEVAGCATCDWCQAASLGGAYSCRAPGVDPWRYVNGDDPLDANLPPPSWCPLRRAPLLVRLGAR